MASFDDSESAWVLHATSRGEINRARHSIFRWDRERLFLQALGFGRHILVNQFQGELSPPWIGRVKIRSGMFQHSEGRDIQTKRNEREGDV